MGVYKMRHEIKYMGLNTDDQWQHFAWSIKINGESFSYKTGLGHAIKLHDKYGSFRYDYKKEKKADTQYISETDYLVEVQKLDSVLYCLFSDADAGMMSFSEFCDNFGYSSDSLKALDIYRECEDTAKRLRKALGTEFYNEKLRIEKLEL